MNGIVPLGYLYLVQRYSLNVCDLFCQSFATDRATKSVVRNGNTVKTYYPVSRYRLDDSWGGQISFALRYEGVNVEVLRAFFNRVMPDDMAKFILAHPLGGVQRRTWFLYEYLTGKRLCIPDGKGGGYAPLVNDSLQYSLPISAASKERRYHILNNLIGNSDFSPFIEVTIDEFHGACFPRGFPPAGLYASGVFSRKNKAAEPRAGGQTGRFNSFL